MRDIEPLAVELVREPARFYNSRASVAPAHRECGRRGRQAARSVAGVRKPTYQRDNPKARRVQSPPAGVDLARVADSCRYVGSPYHKDVRSFAGTSRGRRPDASLCPGDLANSHDRVEHWLREAVREGQVGAWDGGFPRYVWHREGDTVFEARQGSPGSGEYHGYPLEPKQVVRGLA